jgi:glycosyltransferase involved in cell wall biosynthesis
MVFTLRKKPLVSCIMPTKNRRQWVEQSLKMFAEQTYERRELVILDDGDDGLEEVCKGVPGVVHARLSKWASMGEKRNLACEIASGDYIACWDDDDIQHVDRLTRQMDVMRPKWWVDACGVDQAYYLDARSSKTYWYQYCLQPLPPFVLGNSLCFRRSFWDKKKFEHVGGNEDMRFQFTHPRPRIEVIKKSLLVGRIVETGLSPKDFTSPVWTEVTMTVSKLWELMRCP